MTSFSGSVQFQVITALKYLHLTEGDNNKPTILLEKLVHAKGEEKDKIFKEIIINSYPFLFKEGFDLKRTTSKQLQECFEEAGTSGGTTRKSINFFLAAAKSAGIELSPHIKKFKLSNMKTTLAKPKKINDETKLNDQETVRESETKKLSSLEEIWLNKFPNFDPSWTDDVKKSWFEAFRQLHKDFSNKNKDDDTKEE